MIQAKEIVALQDEQTILWHDEDRPAEAVFAEDQQGRWQAAVCRQHRANFELWHIEDEARRPGATDAEMAEVKRRVDRTNQRRNDLAEQLDLALLAHLEPLGLPDPTAELHSESPGLMIDRLSILSLKIFHTRVETQRHDVSHEHVERNEARLKILLEQRRDLAGCLDRLWEQVGRCKRRFKLYRQLKMYNDPTLNPAIYRDSNLQGGR